MLRLFEKDVNKMNAQTETYNATELAERVIYRRAVEAVIWGMPAVADVKDIDFDSTIRYDATFFENLNRIVQTEPWLDRDRVMIDQLKSLGLEKDKPFNPGVATKAILTSAAREA